MAHPQQDTIVESATDADLDAIVSVHTKSFERFFLTSLGPRFLRHFYRRMINDPGGLVLVARLHDQLVGFVAGVENEPQFYSRLTRSPAALLIAISIAKQMIQRPGGVLRRLARALWPTELRTGAGISSSLLSLAVLPSVQGRGVGRQLVDSFCLQMHARNSKRLTLATDREHNDRTNAFYLRSGFTLVRSFVTPEGRAMNQYSRILDGNVRPDVHCQLANDSTLGSHSRRAN